MDQQAGDYIENQLETQIPDQSTDRVSGLLQRLLQELRSQFDPNNPVSLCTKKSRTSPSPNLYCGWGGIVDALFLHREKFPEIDFGTLSDKMIAAARQDKEMRFAGYYMGLGGVLITASRIWKAQGQNQKVEQAAKEIISMAKECLTKPLEFHELLYGTASVLYSVLCVSQQVQCDQLIFDLIKHIVDAGNASYRSDRAGQPFRLVYYFYESEYLGAAHGLIGVIYILLQGIMHLSKNPAFQALINSKILDPIYNSLNFLLHLQAPDGNFPSSIKDYHIKYLQSDRSTPYKAPKLTQFCHGATGFVAPLQLAIKVLSLYPSPTLSPHLLQKAADRAAQHLWKCGLLKKGFNVCHGIVGSAAALAASTSLGHKAILFSLSRDVSEVQQTVDSFDPGNRYAVGSSDFPLSLMEGLAGEIIVLTDLSRKTNQGFPGFDVQFI